MSKKPCELCSGEFEPEYKERRNGYCIWLDVQPESNTLTFMAQANDDLGEMIEDYIEVQMNYCPKCGQKILWEGAEDD